MDLWLGFAWLCGCSLCFPTYRSARKSCLAFGGARLSADVNTTPHRAHFAHANIFSRVSQGLSMHRSGVISQNSHPLSHRSCFARSHPCMITLIFFFLRTGVSTATRTFSDSLADLLNKVPSPVQGIKYEKALQLFSASQRQVEIDTCPTTTRRWHTLLTN